MASTEPLAATSRLLSPPPSRPTPASALHASTGATGDPAAAAPSSLGVGPSQAQLQRRTMIAARHARADSSDSEWSGALPVRGGRVSPSAMQSAAQQQQQLQRRAALVRLVGGWWPLPLRSASTYACLFGLCMLCLVLVDEVATHIRRQHLRLLHADQQPPPSSRQLAALLEQTAGETRAAPLLHVLRHSFLYRCLLCIGWLLVVFAHGLYRHRGRRGWASGRRRNVSSSPVEGSPLSTPPQRSPTSADELSYAAVARKSVSFAAGAGGSASESDGQSPGIGSLTLPALPALPQARPATRKRLRLFFVLALLLALCGVAFELYLALAPSTPPAWASAAASRLSLPVVALPPSWWWGGDLAGAAGSALAQVSWAWALSVLSRVLLVLLWSALLGVGVYFAWYRKAIGTRKSDRPASKRRPPMHLAAIDESARHEDDSGDEWSDEWSEADGGPGEGEKSDESAAGSVHTSPSKPMPPSSVAKDLSSSDASAAVPAVPSSATLSPLLPSPPVGASGDSDEEEEDLSDDDAAVAVGAAPSFPVPSPEALLLAERLDASLFFHPEQPQNQFDCNALKRSLTQQQQRGSQQQQPSSTQSHALGMRSRHGTMSTCTSPIPTHPHRGLAHEPSRRASMGLVGTGSMHARSSVSSSRDHPISSASLLSPPAAPLSLPLSAHAHSSPLGVATLYHLASTKFIHPLSRDDFANLLPGLQWQQYQAGDVIYRQGQRVHSPAAASTTTAPAESDPAGASDGMFIIVGGTVGAVDPAHPAQLLKTYHQGDEFGALEFLFAHLPRALTMRALTDVQLLRIPTSLSRLWSATDGAADDEASMPSDFDSAVGAPSTAAHPDGLASSFSSSSSVSPPTLLAGSRSSSGVPVGSGGGGGGDASSEPRSDILLSFVRTTLARQWRSAIFIFDQFLRIPLTDECVAAMQPPGQRPNEQAEAAATSASSNRRSRYFSPAFSSFFPASSPLLQALQARSSTQVELSAGQSLFEENSFRSDQLFIVLSGSVQLSSTRDVAGEAPIQLGPGSVLNAVSYLTDTTHSHSCKEGADRDRPSGGSVLTRVAWLTRDDLSNSSGEILRLALEVCAVMAPTLAQYQQLGFERKWIRAGTLVFAESEPCDAVYVITSGRVRVVTGKMKRRKRTAPAPVATGAGAGVGPDGAHSASPRKRPSRPTAPLHPSGIDLSPFTETHKYAAYQYTAGAQSNNASAQSASAATSSGSRVKFELARGELVGDLAFVNSLRDGELDASAAVSPTPHSATALCVKDSELIKISRACFDNLTRQHPRCLIKLLGVVSTRMRNLMASGAVASGDASGSAASHASTSVLSSIPRSPFLRTPSSSGTNSCVSVCLLTASPSVPLADFAMSLSLSLSTHGRTMLLTHAHVDRVLGEGTCSQLHTYYSRALLSFWLSHVESHYSFLLFVADAEVNPWTRQCQRQADLTLIVANADVGDEAELSDDDEDDEEEDGPTAPMRARRQRDSERRRRVSRFERTVVWDEHVRGPSERRHSSQGASRGRKSARPADLSIHTSAASAVTHISSFSPSLHPSPDPSDLAMAPPSGSLSSVGSAAGAAAADATSPRAQPAHAPISAHSSMIDNYSRCAPRMHLSLRDLVLLHPPHTSMPHGTRFWLSTRPHLHRFHHVSTGVAGAAGGGGGGSVAGCSAAFVSEHVDRLARYIAGRTVGVVLSGGGARGLAHLGVLSSFAEQGVPIDMIGGTSQGSFMAALYASQALHHAHALNAMRVRVHLLAEGMGSISSLLSDATFPMLSYFAGEKFGATISRILGKHTRIEDLWIPYFLVTTNLSKADMCVHETGRLWKAVRASMTVLDYLPPMQMSRAWPDLLIDGGYTSNLPVEVMSGLFQPRWLVGIDVENKAADEKLTRVSYFGSHLNGWWLLRKRVTEWIKGMRPVQLVSRLWRHVRGAPPSSPYAFFHLPKFAELIGSLVYINHNRNIRQSLAGNLIDLYIRPDLGLTALLDYHREGEIVDVGYACTRAKLTEWRLRNSAHLPKATPPPAIQQPIAYAVHASAAAAAGNDLSGAAAGSTPLAHSGQPAGSPPLSAVASASSLASPSIPMSAGGGGGGSTTTLSRRKTSAASIRAATFRPPPSLTFTHDLTAGGSSASPMQRPVVKSSSASPFLAPTPVLWSAAVGSAASPPAAQSQGESSSASADAPQHARSAAIHAHAHEGATGADRASAHAQSQSQSSAHSSRSSRATILHSMTQPHGPGDQQEATPTHRRHHTHDQLTAEPDAAAATSASATTVAPPPPPPAPLGSLDDSLLAYSSSLATPLLRRNLSEGSFPQEE